MSHRGTSVTKYTRKETKSKDFALILSSLVRNWVLGR